jgi:hypothetical protein
MMVSRCWNMQEFLIIACGCISFSALVGWFGDCNKVHDTNSIKFVSQILKNSCLLLHGWNALVFDSLEDILMSGLFKGHTRVWIVRGHTRVWIVRRTYTCLDCSEDIHVSGLFGGHTRVWIVRRTYTYLDCSEDIHLLQLPGRMLLHAREVKWCLPHYS